MDNKRKNNKRNNKTNTRKKIKNKSKMGFKKVVTIDLLLIVAILAMFIFVKCRYRDAFTDKGNYKSVSLDGTWYKVDLDQMYVMKMNDENYSITDVYGEQSKKGTYEIGNHALKIDDKVYSMKYCDEKKDYKNIIDGDDKDYYLKKYFYTIDDDGKQIFYFSNEEDAADLMDYNCQTNDYYEKEGMFDKNGFAIDDDGVLLAYNGDAREVTLPSKVKAIGENAFSYDYDRALNTEKVIVPKTVKNIYGDGFAFSKVKTVVIEDSNTQIDSRAFDDSNITVEK
ncbi:MAG: leucine-rich repeat protein [Eubacterium sp.]|nr:leucine-rich repeat protein [Eubacterium sp.]